MKIFLEPKRKVDNVERRNLFADVENDDHLPEEQKKRQAPLVIHKKEATVTENESHDLDKAQEFGLNRVTNVSKNEFVSKGSLARTMAASASRPISSLPDEPSADAFERVPVEEFGAAMLRGMGWDGVDSEEEEANEQQPRRAALLGLGAKARGTENEMGAWGKSERLSEAIRANKSYEPIVKINKKTGEVVEESSEEKEKWRKERRKQDSRDSLTLPARDSDNWRGRAWRGRSSTRGGGSQKWQRSRGPYGRPKGQNGENKPR